MVCLVGVDLGLGVEMLLLGWLAVWTPVIAPQAIRSDAIHRRQQALMAEMAFNHLQGGSSTLVETERSYCTLCKPHYL